MSQLGKYYLQTIILNFDKVDSAWYSFNNDHTACNLEQVLATTPHKTPTVRPPASYHENYSS